MISSVAGNYSVVAIPSASDNSRSFVPMYSQVQIYVFAGLPGVGKSTLARALARETGLFHLRVDAIEEPFFRDGMAVTSQGYEAMKNLAAENAALGIGSILDCVNPWPETRALFTFPGVQCQRVEVVCSNEDLHRTRLIDRGVGPTWEEVQGRDYRPWKEADVQIDTAIMPLDEAFALLRPPTV